MRILQDKPNQTRSKMKATGVPPHVTMQNRMSQVERSIESLNEALTSHMQKLPSDLTSEILTHFQVDGAVPVTLQQLQDGFARIEAQLVERDNRFLTILSNNEADGNVTTDGNQRAPTSYRQWTWGGRFHHVPENFSFESMPVRTLWNLWWEGIPNREIGPLKYLKPFSLTKTSQRTFLSKATRVINELVRRLPENNRDFVDVSILQRDAAYETAMKLLVEEVYPDVAYTSKSFEERSYLTIYDKIQKRRS